MATRNNQQELGIGILVALGWMSLVLSCTEVPTNEEAFLGMNTQERKTFTIGSISADNEFDGARLNDFRKLDDSTYQAFIFPENTPVNNSPWFSFRIWSETTIKITVEIAYADEYKHRYVPKLSEDGINWKASEEHSYEMDSISGKLKLDLLVKPEKLWVSAQENLNVQYINTWVNELAQSSFIDTAEIGKSVLGQPLRMLKINQHEETIKHSIVLLGRQHPPEVPGGTISLISFVQTLLSDSELAKAFREKFEILVFPLLNPDGVQHGYWRHNANGKDLNRDWVSFSQPETRSVRDWLTNPENLGSEKEYCFGIDFHTSYSGPYLLTLDTVPHTVKPEITEDWINRIEGRTKDSMDVRPRAQSLPYCYNWLINALGMEAVTYEEGDEIDREIVKQRAATYANVLMEILLEKYELQ